MTGRTKNSTEKTSYVVFKFDFCKSRNLSSIEGTLPLEFPEMPSPEKYQECQTGFEKVMDSLLESKKMTLVESKKNDDAIIHDNRILGFREGVAVLDVCADKKEFYWSNFTENEIHNQPFCKVIIDNRPNKGFLFVEESTIFGGKKGQDKVVALLRDNINRVANQYGWNMVISAKLPPGDFFDAVAERIKAGYKPKAVVFSFPRHQTLNDAPYSFVKQFQMQHSFMECINARKFHARYETDHGEQLHLDKANRDIAMLVNLCSKEDYGIKVYYWKGPCTSSGSLKRTKVKISDAEISALVIGEAVCCDCHGNSQFALINSLDIILDDLKGYGDEVI